MDVILTTQHGFTMTVSVKLDKDGHSYFNADLWRKMSKCYELKAGNKILVRAPQRGLINMDVFFPNVISRSKSDRGECPFNFLHAVILLSNRGICSD